MLTFYEKSTLKSDSGHEERNRCSEMCFVPLHCNLRVATNETVIIA